MRCIKSNADDEYDTPIQLVMDDDRKLSFRVLSENGDSIDDDNHVLSAIEKASLLLEGMLANGPVPVSRINTFMDEHGISSKTAQRARKEIGAATIKKGNQYYWVKEQPEQE